MKTILVVGGDGFIGSHVCETLSAAGHRVAVLNRRMWTGRSEPANGSRDAASGSLKPDMPDELFAGIDVVIHAASTTVPANSDDDPEGDIVQNLVPLVRLLSAMKRAQVRRIIYLSSGGAVYGEGGDAPTRETAALAPLSSYGVVKLAAENYLTIAARRDGLRPIIIRPSNVYGPRQSRIGVQGLISTVLSRCAMSEPIEVWGDGEAERDYLYVTDLAVLCLKMVESDAVGVFNAGSGERTSINRIIALAQEATGQQISVVRRGENLSGPRTSVLDCSAARTVFDWTPRVNLREGIQKTWLWINER
jgi:UDP-glucose 4-epimerase